MGGGGREVDPDGGTTIEPEPAGPVVGAVGEQMLDPRPALADGIEDHLGASAVGEIGRGQI